MKAIKTLFFLCCLNTCYAAVSPIEGAVKAGGFNIQYSETGAGEPLLFVHAGLQDRTMWKDQVNFFSRYYRVITFDLPTHGKTLGADTTLLISDVINILMDSLKIQRASLVGLSLGSVCVTEFVLAHPQRVNKIVLVSPGLIRATELLKADSLSLQLFNQLDTASTAGNWDQYAHSFTAIWCVGPFRDSSVVPAAIRRYIYHTTLDNCYAHARTDWRPFGIKPAASKLENIYQPTFIIAGDKDVSLIMTEARYIHEQVKSSRLWVLKDVAHMLNMEKPAAFNREVLSFLKN